MHLLLSSFPYRIHRKLSTALERMKAEGERIKNGALDENPSHDPGVLGFRLRRFLLLVDFRPGFRLHSKRRTR